MEQNNIIEEVIEIGEDGNAETGNVKISPDVVATIAGIAASGIAGVAGMNGSLAGGIAEIFNSKKNMSKGVKVDIKEDVAIIDIYIIVDYGIRIPELAWEIQENVKSDIETMTGLRVENVNIHIEGISFDKEKNESKAEITNEDNDNDDIIVEETEMEEVPEEGSEEV